jgi:hypothetical protein
MERMHTGGLHWGRWTAAGLLGGTAVLLFYLPLLVGRDVIAWPTTLAAGVVLAAAVLLLMQDARRRTFAWIVSLALPIFALAVVLHNVEYAITGIEEPTFVLIAIVGAPTMLLAGVGGLLWVTIRDRRMQRPRSEITTRAT